MEEITIKPYCEQYWQEICLIHDEARQIELKFASLDNAFLPLRMVAEKEGLFDYKHLDVAIIGNDIVGFCAFSDEELAWLYVAPKLMRKGIGKALVSAALNKEPNLYYVELLLGNDSAKKLYQSFGFEVKEILTGKMPGNEDFQVQVYSMVKKYH